MSNRNLRGWIVRILHRAYPAGMEAHTLQKQLQALGYAVTKRELEVNLAYLTEDGFAVRQQFGIGGYEDELINKTYKLTTKGVDLAEGSIQDEGVEL